MFCFNNEYSIPAAVAFRSLLENASKDYFYKLYVAHTDISEENQQKLQEIRLEFHEHASLEFLQMQNRFEDVWKKTRTKGHYSKEAFYKLIVPSLFPQYEKIIVSDVDVVFLGDVSPSYFSFDAAEDIYVAGVGGVGKILYILDDYKNNFSTDEISKIVINAGYMVYNLSKMRQDNLETSFLRCIESNYWRILQLENDIINLCCYPKIKFLPLENMMCNYVYDLYHTDEDFNNDKTFSELELRTAMENPILIHYPGDWKPWKEDCTKAEEWLKYVIKTPFCEQFRLRSSLRSHAIGSEGVEDLSESNVSTETNLSSMQRGVQATGKAANILAKIRRWIQPLPSA